MKIQELAAAAADVINEGMGESIILTAPARRKAAKKRRLAGVNSPLGEVIATQPDGREVARFRACDVLAWAMANGAAVSVVDSDGNVVIESP